MKILFTGASSFTGMYFVRELLKAGHEVHCTFTGENFLKYNTKEQLRISTFSQLTKNRFSSPFGSQFFFEEFKEPIDVLCLHGAKGQSAGHDSDKFDVMGAVESNTHKASAVMHAAKIAGVKKVVLTGTYFERWNGMLFSNNSCNPAKNEYALSKTITSDIIRFYCEKNNIRFTKFIVPNPFGPYENKRFTTDAAMAWLDAKHITVLNPNPARDNIHVELLAACYAKFVSDNDKICLAPRGYVDSQGGFALRFAREMRKRWHIPCPVDLADGPVEQDYRANVTYAEEYIKQEVTPSMMPGDVTPAWDEEKAWDRLAKYYVGLSR
jgi:nucleoside-diphosphate-sugar epimerase